MYICSSCGGTMAPLYNNVLECEYCGLRKNILTQESDEVIGLKTRANQLLQQWEFDAAAELYSEALALNSDDPELYWLLTMCTYGIEFVTEGTRKIPTCHRTLTRPILQDENFQNALDCADVETREAYEKIASQIQQIQKKIMSIAQKEQPYDVFICYKQTDSNNRRTAESSSARELYHKLIENGYRVFFAEETLHKEHGGQEFEPYIYAALNSASVMILIAYTKEHFQAVWVKNEWSRYLLLQKKKPNLRLIPYFSTLTMPITDLPPELSALEYLDAADHGVSDLLQVVYAHIPPQNGKPVVTNTRSNDPMSIWKEDICYFLEKGEWNIAIQSCDRVLASDPSFGYAYLGKILAQCQMPNLENIHNSKTEPATCPEYASAQKYLPKEIAKQLELAETMFLYNKACQLMPSSEKHLSADAKNRKYLAAADILRQLSGYRDSSFLAAECDFHTAMYYSTNTLSDALGSSVDLTSNTYYRDVLNSWNDYRSKKGSSEEKILYSALANIIIQSSQEIRKKNANSSKNIDTIFRCVDDLKVFSHIPEVNAEREYCLEKLYCTAKENFRNAVNTNNGFNLNASGHLFERLGNYKDSVELSRIAADYPKIKKMHETREKKQKELTEATNTYKFSSEDLAKSKLIYPIIIIALVVIGVVYQNLLFAQMPSPLPSDTMLFIWEYVLALLGIVLLPVAVLFGIKSWVLLIFWLFLFAVVIVTFFLPFWVERIPKNTCFICPLICLYIPPYQPHLHG